MHMDGWQISRSVADKVDGPYKFESLVDGVHASSYGPHSARLPDGRYVLYVDGASTVPTPSGYDATCTGNESKPPANVGAGEADSSSPTASECTASDCYNALCQPQNGAKMCDVCSNAGCVCDPGFGECYPPSYNTSSPTHALVSHSLSGPWET